MQILSSNISSRLSNLAFLCACLVVSIHLQRPVATPGIYLDHFFYGGISLTAVPLFFGISGYLLAGNIQGKTSDWYLKEVCKRIKSILMPFYIWGVLCGLIKPCLLAFLHDYLSKSPIGHTPLFPLGWATTLLRLIALDITQPPLEVTLWFMRNLFLLVLLSPAIIFLCERLRWRWFVLTFILFAIASCHGKYISCLFRFGFTPGGLCAFSIGLSLRKQYIVIPDNTLAACGAALTALICWFFAFFVKPAEDVLSAYNIVIIPCFAYTLWHWCPEKSFPKQLLQATFPIYLLHTIFIGVITLSPGRIPNTNSILGFFLQWFLPIGMSVCTALVFRKFLPQPIVKCLFGNR